MHVFRSNCATRRSRGRDEPSIEGRRGDGAGFVGRMADNWLCFSRLTMQPFNLYGGYRLRVGQLSARDGLLSTQAAARIQLRDPVFASRWFVCSYLPTGVETRSS